MLPTTAAHPRSVSTALVSVHNPLVTDTTPVWSLHKSGHYSRWDLTRLMNLTILETSSFEATVGPGGGGSHGEARWAGVGWLYGV